MSFEMLTMTSLLADQLHRVRRNYKEQYVIRCWYETDDCNFQAVSSEVIWNRRCKHALSGTRRLVVRVVVVVGRSIRAGSISESVQRRESAWSTSATYSPPDCWLPDDWFPPYESELLLLDDPYELKVNESVLIRGSAKSRIAKTSATHSPPDCWFPDD